MNLAEIYKKYQHSGGYGDKGTTHRYIESYERIFAPIRKTAAALLEIGVSHGHSLRMWREYFQNAAIIGIDIRKPTLDLAGCEFYLCSQVDRGLIDKLLKDRLLDVVIDDGSHKLPHQIQSCQHLFPYLRPGGIYIIEDIQDPDQSIPVIKRELGDCEVIDTRVISGRYDDILLVFRNRGS
jgi:SAM-dependent methyltransferase